MGCCMRVCGILKGFFVLLLAFLASSEALAVYPRDRWVASNGYNADEKEFDSPSAACSYIGSKSTAYSFSHTYKISDWAYNCVAYWNDAKPGDDPFVFAQVSRILRCPGNKPGFEGHECPELCPDGITEKPQDGQCPNKCPPRDTPATTYPISEPVGYRCEKGCVVEVSRASGEFPGGAGLPPIKYRQGYYTGHSCNQPQEPKEPPKPPEPKPDDEKAKRFASPSDSRGKRPFPAATAVHNCPDVIFLSTALLT